MPKDHVEVRLDSSDFSTKHVQVGKLVGDEVISQLFRFELDIVVTDPDDVDPDSLPGAEVDIVFELSGAEIRRQHAVITEVRDGLETEVPFRTYHLVLQPRAFRLTMVETQEIFLDLSVPEIIKQKLQLVGLGDEDVEMRLSGTYPKREFVVQYRETDLAFISRLAEHLGISFYFEQHDDKDRIVFSDAPTGFGEVVRENPVRWMPHGEPTDVYALQASRRVMPSSWVMQDYNDQQPLLDITGSHDATDGLAGGVVEYGAHYFTPEEGKVLAKVRAEEREALCRYHEGESDVTELAAGDAFALQGHPRLDDGHRFLVVSVHHEITQVTIGQSSNFQPTRYRNTFRVVDALKNYRPPRVTARPKIHGVATAFIEPNTDQSIGKIAQLDDQGRYTLKVHFDPAPLGGRPRNSHRVRMLQNHSGPNYGTHLPLKAGIEVLLVFVDGDPDRPLIVGSTHNPVTPSPVNVKNALMHRIKTASGILIEMKDDF